MARSQQQWRRGSQVLLLAAALALVVLIAAGSADAAVCHSPYSSCDGNCYNLKNNKDHCGWCNHKCEIKDYKYGEAYCSGKKCHEHCKQGWKYDSGNKECYH